MRTFLPFPQQNTRIGLLGVAFDENSSYMRGAALAPQRIREAFFCDSSNQWTEDETYLGADVSPEWMEKSKRIVIGE